MMKKPFRLPYCALFLLILSTSLSASPKLHVCTVANYEHPFLKHFLDSCNRYSIPLDLLGWGKGYYSHGWALQLIDHYVQTLPDEDLVLVVDAFDVFFLAGQEEIVRRFEELGVSFLISAERGCGPDPQLASFYPPSPTPYRFVNSGTYMGYVKEMKKILKRMPHPICPYENDQRCFTLDFLAHPEDYFLDRHSQFAQTLWGEQREGFFLDPVAMKCTNQITGRAPCIIHGNGYAPLVDEFYNELFLSNPYSPEVTDTKITYVDDYALLLGLIERDAESLSLQLDLADLYFISKEYDKAAPEYLSVLGKFELSRDIQYWCRFQLAQIALAKEAPEEEIKHLFLQAFLTNPAHAEPLSSLGQYSINKGKNEEAYQLLKIARELTYQPFGSYFNISGYLDRDINFILAAYFSGHFAEAKRASQELLDNGHAWYVIKWATEIIDLSNQQMSITNEN